MFIAISFEVLGTLLLPASQNFTKLIPTTILSISYIVSFYFLTFAIQKIPLPIVYASWSGIGVFSVAILNYIFYRQPLAWQAILGLFLIVFGVVLINIFRID